MIEWHDAALLEFEEASMFYDARDPGLGDHFMVMVDAAIHKAAAAPESYRLLDGEVRRVLVNVYPYGIIYRLVPTGIQIIAVARSSRRPGYWKSRIGDA